MFVGPFLGLTMINQFNYVVYFIFLASLSCLSLFFSSTVKLNQMLLEKKSEQEKCSYWIKMIELKAVPVSITAMFVAIAFSGFLTYIPLYTFSLELSSVAGYFYYYLCNLTNFIATGYWKNF